MKAWIGAITDKGVIGLGAPAMDDYLAESPTRQIDGDVLIMRNDEKGEISFWDVRNGSPSINGKPLWGYVFLAAIPYEEAAQLAPGQEVARKDQDVVTWGDLLNLPHIGALMFKLKEAPQ